jgi:hypothetical protein
MLRAEPTLPQPIFSPCRRSHRYTFLHKALTRLGNLPAGFSQGLLSDRKAAHGHVDQCNLRPEKEECSHGKRKKESLIQRAKIRGVG